MHQQRKLPSKRYSSYVPPTELSIEDHVSSIPDINVNTEETNIRPSSVSTPDKVVRRKNLNTLHFDALQSAVSKLSRIDDFDLEELGYGFFSDVFKVTHKQSGKVMVLKRNRNTNTKLNILREIQLMNRLSHPNILKFMGVCVHEGQLHALTEYINGGDVDQLVQQKDTALSWIVRIRIALDISKGLSYLHSMGIFHRDLTAKNCLVKITTDSKNKKTYSALVADLGLAEKIPTKPEDELKLKTVGTPYCMAPEVIHGRPYNDRADLFSFGLIICQLIIRTSYDPEKLPRSNAFGLEQEHFLILVKQGLGAPEAITGTLPASMPPNSFQQLGFDCCEVDPMKRPNIKEIICRLEQSLNKETARRIEKKKLLLVNAQETAKRHNSVLTEITSIKSLIDSPMKQLTTKERTDSDSNKENDICDGQNRASLTPQRRRSSGGSSLSARLSRSSSDVSSEFISHAASIIASSQKSNTADQLEDILAMVISLNEAYVNPFSCLENSELQEKKLFDLPSSEVLEMTFDLPRPRLSSEGLRTNKRTQKRHNSSTRPKSLLLQMPHQNSVSLSPRPITPDACSETRLSYLFSDYPVLGDPLSCPPSPLPVSFSPKHGDLPPHELISFSFKLKHALIRSMALSPQGCRLLSWWRTHGRAADWRSLRSVLSVMTDKLGTLRRSISVPDLSQDMSSLLSWSGSASVSGGSSRSSVTSEKASPRSSSSAKPPSGVGYHPHIYPAYATLPRKKKLRCHSATADLGRKRRSKTSDDVFHDQALLEILHEETTDVTKQNLTSPVDSTLSAIHSDNNTVNVSSQEINNNTSSNYKTRGQIETCNCQDLNSNDLSLRLTESQSDILCPDDGDVSSSSSSSGTSNTGLKMMLKSGTVSSNRRRRFGVMSPNPNNNIGDNASATTHENGTVLTTLRNRDSGYNEEIVFSAENSCDSQSSHDTVDSGLRPRSAPIKSVHFTNPVCLPSHNKPTSSSTNVVHGLQDYVGEVAPRCKVRDANENQITLFGKSH